jgi:hypothetical protein
VSDAATTPAAPPARRAPSVAAGLFVAAGLTVLFFAAVWAGTWALGLGRDIHPLRLAATAGVMFLVALALVFTLRTRPARLVAALAAVAVGVGAWWQVPSRPGGMSLLAAATKREAIRSQLAAPTYDEVPAANQWRNSVDDLAGEYPTLAGALRPEFARWGADAGRAVVERIRETPHHDLPAARAARTRGRMLADVFPDRRAAVEEEYRSWLQRATFDRRHELDRLRPGDWDGFARTGAARRRLAEEHPESREDLGAAEHSWVLRSAGEATETALRALDVDPAAARKACREVEARVRGLPTVQPDGVRFVAARTALFLTAHEAAGHEVLGVLRDGHFDRAFDVALRHGFDWAATAKQLGPNEVKALADLREHARHLAIRFEKAGIVWVAPAPRERQTAPEPRPKGRAIAPPEFLLAATLLAGAARPDAADERKQLEEALDHIRAGKYTFAVARLAPLTKSTTLPAPVVKALPTLIADLRGLDALAQLAQAPPAGMAPAVPADDLPEAVKKPFAWVELLRAVREMVESPLAVGEEFKWPVEKAEEFLDGVDERFGADAAGKLRVELSARIFLAGRPQDATKLIETATPGEHARQVLADLRTIVLGGGTLANTQVARFVPVSGLKGLPGAAALVPASLRDRWQRPGPPGETETTLTGLIRRAAGDVRAAAGPEVEKLAKRVNAAADAMRAELAKP